MDTTQVAIAGALVSRSISTISILVCVSKATTTAHSSTKIKIDVGSCSFTKASATCLTFPIVKPIFMSQPATFAGDVFM